MVTDYTLYIRINLIGVIIVFVFIKHKMVINEIKPFIKLLIVNNFRQKEISSGKSSEKQNIFYNLIKALEELDDIISKHNNSLKNKSF